MSQSEEKLINVRFFDVVKRLWPTLRPYRGKFLLGVVLIALTTATEVISPFLVGRTVDAAIGTSHAYATLYRLCGAYLVLILIKAVFESAQAYVIQSTGQSVTHDLRALLFERIEHLPVAFFDKNPTGRLLTRVVNDIKSLSELFTASISVLALDFMIIVGTVWAMFWTHWKLAAVVLCTFPIVLFCIHYFGGKLAIAYRKVRQRLSEINAFLGESIGAISTIQRLAAESERYEKFHRIVDNHQAAQMESLRVFALVQPYSNILNGISAASLILLGGYWAVQGRITLGIFVSFLGYLRNLFQPVRDLVEKYNTFLSAMVSAERVVALLDEKDEERELENGLRPLSNNTDILFSNVTFHYPTRNANALEGVSFKLPQGTSLAIVGATGSGKSTLIRLLLRFYEPNAGEIQLGGYRLTDWDKQTLRRQIGVVHQEIYLFQGTIRDNLTLGRDRFKDDYLIEQCRRAQLWNFIHNRGGLEMIVYEGGSNFSLGERQLISFARVLVFNCPLLVLDEATSSVDRLLERKLMEAIRETLSGRTSIVIAHRLTTIQECDHILVLEKGRVVEEGSYPSLLRKNGLFRKFHDIHSQQSTSSRVSTIP